MRARRPDTPLTFRYLHSMRRQPKDPTEANRFLWSDLPGAIEHLQSGKVPYATSPDILTTWCRDGDVILDRAAAGSAPDRFLEAMRAALSGPDSDIKMIIGMPRGTTMNLLGLTGCRTRKPRCSICTRGSNPPAT